MRRDENIMKTKELIEAKKENITEWPKVAIIILNWNGWKDTIECLESVLRNTYPNYQIIVIDNASTDGSIEKIKAWADGTQEVLTPEPSHLLYHLSHPPVKKPISYIHYTREEAERGGNLKFEEKVAKEWQERRKTNSKELNPTPPYPLIFIQTGENLGFAGGNNVGIRHMLKKGNFSYVLLLNSDTVVEENFLNELIKSANCNLNIGIIGGKILYYSEPNKIWYAGGKLDLIRGSGYHKNYNRIDNGLNGKIKTSFVTGCLMLINRKVFDMGELLPEEYFLYVEDTDFCYFVLKKNYDLLVNLNSRIYHKISSSIFSSEIIFPEIVYYSTRNRLHFVLRKQEKKFIDILNLVSFILFYSLTRIYKIFRWLVKGRIDLIIITFEGIHDGFACKLGRRKKYR